MEQTQQIGDDTHMHRIIENLKASNDMETNEKKEENEEKEMSEIEKETLYAKYAQKLLSYHHKDFVCDRCRNSKGPYIFVMSYV